MPMPPTIFRDHQFVGRVTPRKALLAMILPALAGTQPALERLLALAAASAGQQPFDPNMFIEIGPLHRIALSQQLPMVALLRGAVDEARIPIQGNNDAAAIVQAHGQPVIGDGNVNRRRLFLKHQSNHDGHHSRGRPFRQGSAESAPPVDMPRTIITIGMGQCPQGELVCD